MTIKITMGSRGCGKMEAMRKDSGLTPEEFDKNLNETLKIQMETRKRLEAREQLDRILWMTLDE